MIIILQILGDFLIKYTSIGPCFNHRKIIQATFKKTITEILSFMNLNASVY